jgi:hypothetical protein
VIQGKTKEQSVIGGAIYTGVFALALIIFWFVKQDLRRVKFEDESMETSLLGVS